MAENNVMAATGRILEHAVGESKTSKTQQITFRLELIDGPRAGENVYVYKYLTEKAIDNTIADLRKLGWNGTDFRELFTETPGAHSFSGVEVRVYAKSEPYEGKMQEKWNFSFGGALKSVDVSAASKLQAAFGANLKMAKPVVAASATVAPRLGHAQAASAVRPTPTQQPSEDAGESIPF